MLSDEERKQHLFAPRQLDKETVEEMLNKHEYWLRGCPDMFPGERADFSFAYLNHFDFSKRSLTHANFKGAQLQHVNFSKAELNYADFEGACLCWANCFKTSFYGANFEDADLTLISTCETDFSYANFKKARISRETLAYEKLFGTCLDPNSKPSGADNSFVRDGDYIFAYANFLRTHPNAIEKYVVSSKLFSVCPESEEHPGLRIYPSREALEEDANLYIHAPCLQVKTYAKDVHKAGNRYRCRWFEVIKRVF